jgi:tetratricopeptide (TPR) repeat protein
MRSTPFAKTLCLTVATALALPCVAPSVASAAGVIAPPPSSPAGDPSTMTPEQKLDRAKQLFGEGNAALEAGDAATALARFEDAYLNYTPDRHKFNFNIGQAAYAIGDCVKARAAFQRFLDLVPADPNRGDAQVKVMEIDRSGCANVQPTTTDPTPVTNTTPSGPTTEDEEDAPVLTGRKQEREQAIERERDAADSKKTSPLVIAGAALTVVGVGVLVGGVASLAIANKKANELADLASPGATGFPAGNYADDDVFDKDRNQLPRLNTAAVIMMIAGPALLVGGITMLAIGVSRKKKAGKQKKREAQARAHTRPQLIGIGPSMLPRGAGASAMLRF